MKTLVIAAALPLSWPRRLWHRPPAPRGAAADVSVAVRPDRRPHRVSRAAAKGNTVYDNNQYLGADPDPNVRLDLRRDYEGPHFLIAAVPSRQREKLAGERPGLNFYRQTGIWRVRARRRNVEGADDELAPPARPAADRARR